jgi:hypothetical protein
MEQARPGSSALMTSALRHDPEATSAIQETVGRERVSRLVDGMEKEKQLLADPNVRADRIIDRWQVLKDERQALKGWSHDEERGKIEGEMRKLTTALEKDPTAEAIVNDRASELGISHVRESQGIAREMERQLSQGRSQGMER